MLCPLKNPHGLQNMQIGYVFGTLIQTSMFDRHAGPHVVNIRTTLFVFQSPSELPTAGFPCHQWAPFHNSPYDFRDVDLHD